MFSTAFSGCNFTDNESLASTANVNSFGFTLKPLDGKTLSTVHLSLMSQIRKPPALPAIKYPRVTTGDVIFKVTLVNPVTSSDKTILEGTISNATPPWNCPGKFSLIK